MEGISAIEAAGDYIFVAAGSLVLGYLRGKQVISLIRGIVLTV